MARLLGIVADINLLEEDGEQYVRIVVEPYPVPIGYRGAYHYRSGSTKQVLKGAALDRFLLGKTGRRWDAVPVPDAALEDLDATSLTRFRASCRRTGLARSCWAGIPRRHSIRMWRTPSSGPVRSKPGGAAFSASWTPAARRGRRCRRFRSNRESFGSSFPSQQRTSKPPKKLPKNGSFLCCARTHPSQGTDSSSILVR